MLDQLMKTLAIKSYDFAEIWELKSIRFNVGLEGKHYEKLLGESNEVEDVVGNFGIKGHLQLSNLRITWRSRTDKDANISIGLDTVYSVDIKEVPVYGYDFFKHVLLVKAINQRQVKYQFKFMAFREKESSLFKKIRNVVKEYLKTKTGRNIDNQLKQIQLMPSEEIKTSYQNCIVEVNAEVKYVTVTLTNIRLILAQPQGTSCCSIPWITVSGLQKVGRMHRIGVTLKVIGISANSTYYLGAVSKNVADAMQNQIICFAESYSKHPNIGIDFTEFEEDIFSVQQLHPAAHFLEIEESCVKIGKNLKLYGDENRVGSIQATHFEEQLGIMMENFPKGSTRKSLWQLLS